MRILSKNKKEMLHFYCFEGFIKKILTFSIQIYFVSKFDLIIIEI